jgi:hypothetical protein
MEVLRTRVLAFEAQSCIRNASFASAQHGSINTAFRSAGGTIIPHFCFAVVARVRVTLACDSLRIMNKLASLIEQRLHIRAISATHANHSLYDQLRVSLNKLHIFHQIGWTKHVMLRNSRGGFKVMNHNAKYSQKKSHQ